MRKRTELGQFVPNPDGLQPTIFRMVEAGETSRKAMAEATGISQRQVARVLSNLAARGLIEECGTIPNGNHKPLRIYQVKGKVGFTFRPGLINSVFALAA